MFLLFAALVIDVGNWYTHKRSLQTVPTPERSQRVTSTSVPQELRWDSSDGGAGSVALTNAAKEYAGAASGDYNT